MKGWLNLERIKRKICGFQLKGGYMEKHTKQEYINEVLRLCRILTQCKYNSADDKNIKRLIAENLQCIGKIEHEKMLLKGR